MDMSLVSFRSWWWTEEPGVLQSMGSQRIGHDWETELNWGSGSRLRFYTVGSGKLLWGDIQANIWRGQGSRVYEAGTSKKKERCLADLWKDTELDSYSGIQIEQPYRTTWTRKSHQYLLHPPSTGCGETDLSQPAFKRLDVIQLFHSHLTSTSTIF